MTLQRTRHRLDTLRNDLTEQLRKLKSGSTIAKITKGRMGGVMDAIEICDQELLAEEQGRVYYTSGAPVSDWGSGDSGISPDKVVSLTADQLAWLAKRKGDV